MKKEAESYVRAMSLLPAGLQDQVRLSEALMAKAEEMRLRIGRPASAVLPDGELITGTRPITREDLGASVIEIATGASAYTARDSIKAGYITARAALEWGRRLSRDKGRRDYGLSRGFLSCYTRVKGVCGGGRQSGAGTYARREILFHPDYLPAGRGERQHCSGIMVRLLSDGEPDFGIKGRRTVERCVDERGEVAGMMDGVPQKNVGARTDVIDGCSKDRAVIMMLRAMNPEIIAIDEITDPGDIAAIECAANCGVKLLATAHAENLDDLKSRRMYLRLLHTGVFKKAVFIEKSGGRRTYRVRELRGDYR